MVQAETSQLTDECTNWRSTLRNYREEFNQDKLKLQQASSSDLSKEQLQDVEHLHNQLHIQLINIHDLKQAIKAHNRTIENERAGTYGLRDETLAEHETLYSQYQSLENTLQDLRTEFDGFLSRT